MRTLTRELVRNGDGCAEEYARYVETKSRSIEVCDNVTRDEVAGQRILVTGASGCIGSSLLDLLVEREPRELVGVGVTQPSDYADAAIEYHEIDVRDRAAVRELFSRKKPSVVFHLAAQRHPGLAEQKVHETVSTNVDGTRNVLDAAIGCGAEKFVFASTGKAVRPHTFDVYAASKKVSEWLVSRAAAAGEIQCAVARFTHVVDNGIVFDRLRRWVELGEAFQLHSPESPFYVQSALESAQLLLCSLPGCSAPELQMFAINNLGWPVTALGLAFGVLKDAGKEAHLEVVGPQPGYEQDVYPGLYDPAFGGDVSPLFNFTESFSAQAFGGASEVDQASLTFDGSDAIGTGVLDLLARRRETDIRRRLDSLLWDLFRARLPIVPASVLKRIARVTEAHRTTMSAHHVRIDDSVRAELAARDGLV